MVSSVWRKPAVSIKRNNMPPMTKVSSIVSRVVPWMSLTIARSSPNRALSRVDLPTLGAPIMATGIPCLMALPVLNEATRRPILVSISCASSFSWLRSANSNSSWSAKSSSSSMSEVIVSNRSLNIANSLDIPPLNWLSAKSFSALVCAAIRSATASASVRSILPLRNARWVNSPALANWQPTSTSHWSKVCWIYKLPWQAISTTSSPVKEWGARNTLTSTWSSISSSPFTSNLSPLISRLISP